jgi:diguanylate cyclase (GGDEF)-like protein
MTSGSVDVAVARPALSTVHVEEPPRPSPEQEQERARRREARLVRLAHELATSLDPGTTAVAVARGLAELIGGRFVATYLADEAGVLELAGLAAGPLSVPPQTAPGLAQRAFSEGRLVQPYSAELVQLHSSGATCEWAIAVAMVARGEPLGSLLLGLSSPQVDTQLVSTIADLAASSVANARRYATTFAEARRDALTGLNNHRAFHEHVNSLLREALATKREVSLVLFDLDHFKRINDSEGHPAGDKVLVEIGRLAMRTLRPGEEVFRLGGEEFAIVVRGSSDIGVRVAERVREAVAGQRRGLSLPTLSAGVAGFPDDARTKDELLHKADIALYAAKSAGRNQVIVYNSDLQGAVGRSTGEVSHHALQERMATGAVREVVHSELSEIAESILTIGREKTIQGMLDTTCRQLVAVLGATACSISRVEGTMLKEVSAFWPWPFEPQDTEWDLAEYPLTREVIAAGQPRAVSLQDDGADPAEVEMLQTLQMQSLLMLPLVVDGQVWGIAEVLDASQRVFRPTEETLGVLVMNQVASLLSQLESSRALQRLYREMVAALSTALEAKDAYTSRHTSEVVDLAVDVSGWLGLSGDDLRAAELGALLHDVGKIRIPESILNKPGALSREEWAVVRTHPEVGEKILAPIASLRDVLPIVRSHHERWDGLGYPDRLAGEKIPLGARIVAVCDAFRAMVEPRPYRGALDVDRALQTLRAGSGSQFDPACVEALFGVLADRERQSGRARRPARPAGDQGAASSAIA